MRFMPTDDGAFLDTETGEVITIEEMMKRTEEDVYNDKGASAKNASTGKKTLLRQGKKRI